MQTHLMPDPLTHGQRAYLLATLTVQIHLRTIGLGHSREAPETPQAMIRAGHLKRTLRALPLPSAKVPVITAMISSMQGLQGAMGTCCSKKEEITVAGAQDVVLRMPPVEQKQDTLVPVEQVEFTAGFGAWARQCDLSAISM